MNIFIMNIFNKCEYILYNDYIHEYILMNIFMNIFFFALQGKHFNAVLN